MKQRIRHSLIVLCVCILSPIGGFSQDSSPGYIINSNGDRTEGLILNGSTLNRYFGCNFRRHTDEAFTYYTPDQIMEYGFTHGPYFKSIRITLDLAPQKMFGEVKLDGLISIYTFFDRSFIAKNNQQTELTFTPAQAVFNQNLIVQIMQDCDRLSRRLEMQFTNNLDYVIELARIYNSCSEPEPERNIQFGWHPFMGIDLIRLKLTMEGTQYDILNGTTANNSKLMTGGFYISLKHKSWRSLKIYTGASYVTHSFRKLITNNQQIDEVHLESKNLNIPLYLVFTAKPTDKKWMPFMRLGIQKPFTLDSRSKWVTETESGNLVFIKNKELFKSYREPILVTLTSGTNIQLGKLLNGFMELSYNFGKKEIEHGNKVSFSGIQFRLGINY